MSLDDLTDVDDDGDSAPSSSQRQYVQPDKLDFEEFLDSTGLEWELDMDATSNEHVYDSHDAIPQHNGVVLRVFSTIDERTDKARGKGVDAIRLVIWDKHISKPVGGRTKTLRIKTWEKNLREKIESITDEWKDYVETCDECGEMMVIRDGQYGEFLGCKSYPDCKFTKEIEDD